MNKKTNIESNMAGLSGGKGHLRILLSGGGTGGHIFPAIAVADEIKKRFPDAELIDVKEEEKE